MLTSDMSNPICNLVIVTQKWGRKYKCFKWKWETKWKDKSVWGREVGEGKGCMRKLLFVVGEGKKRMCVDGSQVCVGIVFWVEFFFLKSHFLCFSINWNERCGNFVAIKITINLALKELCCLSVLHCRRWCWIVTESEFIVAAGSLLKSPHTTSICGCRMKKGF